MIYFGTLLMKKKYIEVVLSIIGIWTVIAFAWFLYKDWFIILIVIAGAVIGYFRGYNTAKHEENFNKIE